MEKLFKKSDKKKTTSSSAKKGKTGAGAMSSVSSDPRMLDIKSMNFGKFAYQSDKAYQAIKKDMVNYNASLSGENTMENGQKTLKLMQDLLKKCSDYLYNNTTGEVVKHQARCENVENLIYEITMKGGTILKAQQNLKAMRGASEDQAKINMMATELGYAVDGSKNNYSKTMQMITSDVLASQDATKVTIEGSSGAKRHYKQGYDDRFDYDVKVVDKFDKSNPQNYAEGFASALHEFTHVDVNKKFGGNAMCIAGKINNEDDKRKLKQESDKRVEETKKLIEIGRATNNDAVGYAESQILDYGTSSRKKNEYQNVEKFYETQNMYNVLKGRMGNDNANTILSKTKQNDRGQLLWTDLYKEEHEKAEVVKKQVLNGKEYETRDKLWRAKENVDPKINMTSQYKNLDLEENDVTFERLDSQSKESILTEFKQHVENSDVDVAVKENLRKQAQLLADYDEVMKDNYDSMIEYDSVVNQALMLYEYQHPEDRSSQYYRQLKAMAFRAHIRRLEQRLVNEEAEVENMANDGYTNLTPSAKGSMADRAYERRAIKMGWQTTY